MVSDEVESIISCGVDSYTIRSRHIILYIDSRILCNLLHYYSPIERNIKKPHKQQRIRNVWYMYRMNCIFSFFFLHHFADETFSKGFKTYFWPKSWRYSIIRETERDEAIYRLYRIIIAEETNYCHAFPSPLSLSFYRSTYLILVYGHCLHFCHIYPLCHSFTGIHTHSLFLSVSQRVGAAPSNFQFT